MKLFEVQMTPSGRVNVHNVPIFKAHLDRKYKCDETWLDRCVSDFWAQKAESVTSANGEGRYAVLPSITVGHTPIDPDAPEPPSVGFVDNLRRVGNVLYCSFMDLPNKVWELMKSNAYPYRSAEVMPSKFRLTNVSLLGGRYPHFALPIMRFTTMGGEQVIRYTMMGGSAEGSHLPENGGVDIESLARTLAPLVAQLLAESQANSPEGTRGAAAYRSDGVSRHAEESDAGKHTSQTADAVKDDTSRPSGDSESVNTGSDDMGKEKEKFGQGSSGQTMSVTDRNSGQHDVKGLISRLAAAEEKVQQLQQHSARQAMAARRSMIKSKCRELLTAGYSIGDEQAVERHVERMMQMDSGGVKQYIEDVLKQSPRVQTRRYGLQDTIERPGSSNQSDNERYVDENPHVKDMGLDGTVLDLADVLGE